MDISTMVMVAAFVAVLISLSGGIFAMVNGGEIGHKTETQWMAWRVGLQGSAVVLLLLLLLSRN